MSRRLFAAIDLPEPIPRLLAQLDPHLPGLHWTAQLHLTLGFFASVTAEAEAALCDRLKAIEYGSFFLPIRELGAFPGKGPPRIIWIGVGRGHPHLFQLHKRVQESALAAAIEPDLRPWHPHITLARCADVGQHTMRKFLQENYEFDAGCAPVEAFHLYASRLTPSGSVHEKVLSVGATQRRQP